MVIKTAKDVMNMPIELDFYYGNEADEYSFYRIPKALFTDARFMPLSTEAKVLYGLLLDRMGLSVLNNWFDKSGRVFIYFTIEDVTELLGCGHGKAVRLFAELDSKSGVGLIERKKQGQGRPTQIYVKKFIAHNAVETSQNGAPTLPETDRQTSQKRKSAHSKRGSLDFPKTDANDTERKETDLNDTDLSIHPPTPCRYEMPAERWEDRMDGLNSVRLYTELIQDNISYQTLLERSPHDREALDGLVDLMVETVCTRKKYISIGREDLPADLVKSRFLKLDESHIEYVMDSLRQNTTKIYNIRAYLLTALYRASTTLNAHYTAQVNHDLYGSGDG